VNFPRAGQDSGRFQGGRLRLVKGACHPDPPAPPGHLTRREPELFRQAWREPESALWRRSDAARVARWAHLAARAEESPASWVYTQLNVLEDAPRIAAEDAIAAARRGSDVRTKFGAVE
jgi:hypothetical protein